MVGDICWSEVWDAEHRLALDVRRMRPVLRGLEPPEREVVVRELRLAFPQLAITVDREGTLRIEGG